MIGIDYGLWPFQKTTISVGNETTINVYAGFKNKNGVSDLEEVLRIGLPIKIAYTHAWLHVYPIERCMPIPE